MAKTFFFFELKEGEMGVYLGDLLEGRENYYKDKHPGILITEGYALKHGLRVEYKHPWGIPVLKPVKKRS